MKKFAAVILFAVAAAAKAADVNCPTDKTKPCVTFFDAVTSNTTSDPIDLTGFSRASVRLTSQSTTCACVITMSRRNSSDESWSDPVVTWTNPTNTQLGYDMIGAGQVQFIITYSAGSAAVIGTVSRVK